MNFLKKIDKDFTMIFFKILLLRFLLITQIVTKDFTKDLKIDFAKIFIK